jgi:hypothetical protein
MSRWVVALMLVLLPLQFSWAAVASYCQHERSTSTTIVQHVGHHEHQHKADGATGKSVVVEKNLDKFDPDCSSCHGLGLGALFLPDAKLPVFRGNEMNAPALSALAGVSPIPPDRPQWPFLA